MGLARCCRPVVAAGTAEAAVAGIDEAAEAAEAAGVDSAAALQAEPGDAEYNRLPSRRTLLPACPLLRCSRLERTQKQPDGFTFGGFCCRFLEE